MPQTGPDKPPPLAEGRLRSTPLTDEEIKQATVGEPTPVNGQITLIEYDPAWPEHFGGEAARIRGVLGVRARHIEHIGSTSVPGLAAKPIIDIMLVVADSADEPSYVPALEAAGYMLRIREPEWHEHRMFKGPGININLHVYTEGSAEIERLLLLRGRLRDNGAERDLYEQTKRRLAWQHWTYVQNYADAKSEVIEAIIARARASASHEGPA
jgi:GrpB-like predicted nucleotidyltransferase (UPF0157 family)